MLPIESHTCSLTHFICHLCVNTTWLFTPTLQLKFLRILPPATSLTMHVAHFSLQEFSDKPTQSLMIVKELSQHCCCVSDPKFSSSLLAAAVGTGGPFLSISFEERTQTPPASSPTSVLIPLYSPLRTLLSVLQCRHHYQTDSSPVLAALRSGATCARSSAASSCHTGSRTAALARGDDGDPHCWSGREGGRREGTPPPPPPPPTLARGRARISMK